MGRRDRAIWSLSIPVDSRAPPVVTDETVYLPGLAVDDSDGSIRPELPGNTGSVSAVVGDFGVAASESGVVAFDTVDGAVRWGHPIAGSVRPPQPAVGNDRVYVAIRDGVIALA